MKKGTHSSKRQAKSRIKKRYNRNKFLQKVTTLQQQSSSDDESLDRISQLPDEILISILCRLPSKKAIATGILSTRWRHLYTFIDHLEFPPVLLGGTKEEFANYVYRIEHTFDLFSANAALKTLSFNVHQRFGASPRRWIEFALARKVETIDIHLWNDEVSILCTLQPPYLIGEQSFSGHQSLKKLVFSGMDLDDLDFDLVLSALPRLETLSISDSKRLKNVSLVNRGHPLKHLHLYSLENLESVEIRDMISLVSFTCYGQSDQYALELDNVPNLTEFCVSENGTNVFPSMQPSIRDQVRSLGLMGDPTILSTEPLYQLRNVKHLDLFVRMFPGYSNHQLRKFFLLIAEYTSLETLDVEFKWNRMERKKVMIEEIDVPPTMKQSCPNLKRVALSGYNGYKEELDFALLILINFGALQQLIVEIARDLTPNKRRGVTARSWKQFREVVPSSMDLLIN